MALPPLKKKPSGIYYVDLRGRGLGRVSLETRDRNAAIAKRREVLAADPETLSQPEQSRKRVGKATMNELFERAQATVWRTAKSQGTIRSNIKILGGLIGDEDVTDMTYTRLEKLAQELKDMGYAPATVKRKLDAVSKVLTMAAKWTDDEGRPLLTAKPPMPSIRVDNQKDRVLSRVEEAALFNAVEARRQAEPNRQWRRYASLLRFLLDTGARLGEALETGPQSLSTVMGPDGEPVTLVTFARYRTKSDKPRSVPLTTAAQEALEALSEDLGFSRKTKEVTYFPLTSATAWYMFKNLREDLKEVGLNIDDVTLHTLRHTCLTRLAQGGMELLRLQKWAGHSDPKITAERYVHLRTDDLVGGLDILQRSNPISPTNVTFMEATAKGDTDGTVVLN
ncbi:tyrosine-type recombinase/integrase [Croceicoccus naphthovorans]|uniref:Uncharacterized protein n=1 Tax=Croceicoccus naphthovorans TaxID=1348774 RepID=A0A0G3XDT5_9SPHN|nr:site-specific integrase [Croceicoccus naphthovorans]AKM09362.1 hypothetical protein AB433_04180 [Croceicoccus naphthovorans]MBB3990279.1 integrase [Croceicoccus naphthovorans]